MYVVTSDETTLALHHSRGGRWMSPKPFDQWLDVSIPVSSPAVLNRLFIDRHGAKLWFCDERWRLHVLDVADLSVKSLGESVVAWSFLPSKGEVAAVQRAPNGSLELRTVFPLGSASVRVMDGEHRVSLGYVVASSSGAGLSFVAVGTGDGGWHLCSPPWPTPTSVRLSAETPVYGAALLEGRLCLLVRSSARERLDFFDGKAVIASLTFPDEVEHACLHPNGHWIAAQVAGGLCVVDRRGREYLRWGGPWA
jgi:hypothetical protein